MGVDLEERKYFVARRLKGRYHHGCNVLEASRYVGT